MTVALAAVGSGTTPAVKGDSGLIRQSAPGEPIYRMMPHNQWQGKRNYLCEKGETQAQSCSRRRMQHAAFREDALAAIGGNSIIV